MRSILFIAFIINIHCLFGQRIELFTGANKNTFYDKDGTVNSFYNSGFGFSAGIGLDSIISGKLKTRLTLQFDSYCGTIEVAQGGASSGQKINAKINKSVIGLCFFPLNIRIKKKLDFNLGIEMSRIINEKYSGVIKGFDPIQQSYSYDLKEKYNKFSAKKYAGIKVRIAYDIYLSNSIAISPQYLFYLGLSSEFAKFPFGTKSIRQFAFIGIRKKIN